MYLKFHSVWSETLQSCLRETPASYGGCFPFSTSSRHTVFGQVDLRKCATAIWACRDRQGEFRFASTANECSAVSCLYPAAAVNQSEALTRWRASRFAGSFGLGGSCETRRVHWQRLQKALGRELRGFGMRLTLLAAAWDPELCLAARRDR